MTRDDGKFFTGIQYSTIHCVRSCDNVAFSDFCLWEMATTPEDLFIDTAVGVIPSLCVEDIFKPRTDQGKLNV